MPLRKTLPVALLLLPLLAGAAPLTIDVTAPVPPAHPAPYGPGTTTDPDGDTITADSQSFFLDGKPWIPVMGEFHYSRYPRDEWRDELMKMKAGGITVVSTYVFWIHQEQNKGVFDWSGQRSLKDFLLLCKELDLKAVVRLGPWCHGEVRNGGFPDWVHDSGTKLRTDDPAFLKLVEPLYQQEAKQMKGLLWKDGGPVIGVQLDNECNNAPYLAALKKMAIAEGIDVPVYNITGWQITVPASGFMPLFGGYADGFWGGTPESYRREFMFTDIRATNNLGAQMNDEYPSNSKVIAQFPYLCAEIGPGMMSSWAKRIKIDPDVVTAMALSKLGCGSNMPGYYMYHGGVNPDAEPEPGGALPYSLQETHPNFMPLKDYDFQTAIGACGEVRDQFHLLLEQHLFLQDFGDVLARMPAFFPDQRPTGLNDFQTLRWDVRSDGTSGFLFFSNEQPIYPLPAHENVQFQIKTAGGNVIVPGSPITIPTGSYGIWPFNIDCGGVTILYSTAQLLCHIDGDQGQTVYFLGAMDGIPPRLALDAHGLKKMPLHGAALTGDELTPTSASNDAVAGFIKPDGTSVLFVILTAKETRHIWRANFDGQDRLIISNATVLSDARGMRLLASDARDLAMSIFPPVSVITNGSNLMMGDKGLVFSKFAPASLRLPAAPAVTVTQETAPSPVTLSGTLDAAWKAAAVYNFTIPPEAAGRNVTLNLHYNGDAARVYIGDRLFDDNYSNGEPMAVALWRIPADHWPLLRLKVLPRPTAPGVTPADPGVFVTSSERVEVRLAAP